MFTGLVEEIGVVESVISNSTFAKIKIRAEKIMDDIKLGDSVSTNGVCLTVTEYSSNSFTVDVMPESMRRSNLKDLKNGSLVNLERAMKSGDRFGGHIVSGHIDGTGDIKSIVAEGNAHWLEIEAPSDIMKYVVFKGSITIDGTSLTVADEGPRSFKVSIIPLTKEETTLLKKKVGDQVNLECDLVGKYISKFISQNESPKRGIDENFLRESGFMF